MSGLKRLVTKCDIDGLASGILLKEMNLVHEALFCHPRDIESGAVQITGNDITAGLPGRESAYLAFDHYQDAGRSKNIIVNREMRSTARVIYNHFGADRFSRVHGELLKVVDKVSSADVTLDDILYPSGWMLLAHLIDQRTGLERYGHFSVSSSRLLEQLIAFYGEEHTVWDILSLPPVEERSACYFDLLNAYKSQVFRCAAMHNNLLVVDLRNEETLYPGNRFMVDALFPECNVSMQITRPQGREKTLFAAGKSFLDRSLDTDIGKIMREHGGGGHKNAGTCNVKNELADAALQSLITSLKYGTFKNLFMGYYNYYY